MSRSWFCLFSLVTATLAGELMVGSPPAESDQVTLDNWILSPYNRWGYVNVRRLFPTAEVKGNRLTPPLEKKETALMERKVSMFDGEEWSLRDLFAKADTDGLIVLHQGKVVAEEYYNLTKPDSKHVLYSITKSIVGTLAGLYVEEGRLDPEALVVKYVPELVGSGYEEATVQNVLDMGVDLEERADEEFTSFNQERWSVYKYVATLAAGEAEHGKVFEYRSPNACVMGWILEKIGGKPLTDLISERLWIPMGAEDSMDAVVDFVGTPVCSGGFSATLRDMARFGLLIQQGGKGVVPSEWVEDIRYSGDKEAFSRGELSLYMPGGAYRNFWWIKPDGSIAGIGAYGQLLYINFEEELVVVKLASQEDYRDLEAYFLTEEGIREIRKALIK